METITHERNWWGRITKTVVVREPEWDDRQRNLVLAHLELEENMGPHGIPMDVATDTANQFRFTVGLPTTDFAAHALKAAQDAYYEKYDKNKDRPMNRAGHLWSVHLKKDGE